MSNIKSYGIALPHFRIEDTILHPKGRKERMRSVCFADEDIITLSFEAATNCFESLNLQNSNFKSEIDGIFFATSTPVFHNRYHASFLADLLNLPQGILALDFTISSRSGTDALLLANDLIDSNKYKNILVIASDVDFPEIGKELFTPIGHAACAILLSHEKGIAQIIKSNTFSSSYSEEFIYKNKNILYDPRFSRDAGFKTNIIASLRSFITNPKAFDSLILNSPYNKMAAGIFAKAGIEEIQLANDTLSFKLGNTGATHSLLLLVNEIENNKKNILLVDYHNGTNFFKIYNHGSIIKKVLQDQLQNFELINSYQEYLLIQKATNFNSTHYKTKEMFSSEMMQEREKETLLYLQGMKCEICGTVYYLKSERCKKCKGNLFSNVQLANTGAVYTFTNEHYFPTLFPPVTMLVIDLDNGGRITLQQTDTMYPEKRKSEIGTGVRLVLRKIIENDEKPNYFWKAIEI